MAEYGQLYQEAEQFRRALLRREREAASELVRYYGEIWRSLNLRIQALVTGYYSDPSPSQNWLFRYDRLAALRAQVEEQIRAFSRFAEERIKAEQLYLIDQAQWHSEQLVRLGLSGAPGGFRVNFNRLAVDAITDLVGMLQSGSPLRDLLNELPGDAGQAVADGLIRGVALGLNPRAVAREIRQALGGNLVRALRIARTEQLRAYREATRRNYQANDRVIKGWIWVSARNERTCAACWAKHGSEHSLDEPMEEHPNGRCTKVPWLKTWKELGFTGIPEGGGPVESGTALFARLPAEQQIKILGPAKYTAYREGRLSLNDLVGRKVSPTWGVTHYERSLKELGLDKIKLLKDFRDYRIQQLSAKTKLPNLADIQNLTTTDVLVIGELNKSIVGLWTEKIENNLEVVLTAPRREHYLSRHSEMRKYENLLVDAVLNPDEIHRNLNDAMTAIFYKKIDDEHYLRLAVLMQSTPGELKHSILSFRIASTAEVVKGTNKGRYMWG